MMRDYLRHSIATLFVVLNVLEGGVIGRYMQRHRHQEFICFLDTIEAEVPAGRLVQVALDDEYAGGCGRIQRGARPPPSCDL